MSRLSKKLAGDIGLAVYAVSCVSGRSHRQEVVNEIISRVGDALEANSVDPEEFQRAAGWDEEERVKDRLAKMRHRAAAYRRLYYPEEEDKDA